MALDRQSLTVQTVLIALSWVLAPAENLSCKMDWSRRALGRNAQADTLG